MVGVGSWVLYYYVVEQLISNGLGNNLHDLTE